METVKVIGELCCFAEPLTVKLTPESFTPTGVGDGEVESVGIYIVPMLCGRIMTECILVGMGCDAGITGCSGGEEHEHRIVAAGGLFCAVEVRAEAFHFHIEIVPAFFYAADQNF